MNLNLVNVEELIFYNQRLQVSLPKHRHLFDQWKLAKMSPSLRSLGKRAILDFLNDLDEESLKILENHFGCKITLSRVNYCLISNHSCHPDEAEEILNKMEEFVDLTIYRDENHLYLSCWK